MRVLVTGASGHVGGAAARALAAAGHTVVAGMRHAEPSMPFERAAIDLGAAGIAEKTIKDVAPCAAIVHAAARISFAPVDDEVPLVNRAGTDAMLKVAAAWGRVPFVFISSFSVLGTPIEHPIRESHPLQPGSPYAESKRYGEEQVRNYSEQGGRGVSLRVSSPVGPGLRARRIFSIFVEAALNGETLRVSEASRPQDYIDARDIADAIVACVERPVAGLFNVASGRPVSNLELAQRAVAALGSASTIETAGDSGSGTHPMWDVSIEAAGRAFGFRPRRTLEDSVRDFAAERANTSGARQ